MSRWRKRKPSSPGNCGRSGRISSCRTSAASRGSTSGSSGASACTAPRWKTSPSTAPRSSTAPLRVLELVEPRGQERPQRRRHVDLAVVGREREHLGDEERVAARPLGDPPSAPPPAASLRSARPPRRARAVPAAAAPARTGAARAAPAGPCTGAAPARPPKQSRRLDEVEERLLAPLQIVEADDERRLLLEQLAERPGDLVRARRTVALAEQRSQRGGRLLVGGQGVELLDAPRRRAST